MEHWLTLLPGGFVLVLFGGLGYAIKYRKAYWLISGYNTMPEEKKKNVDAEGLGRFIGNCLLVGGAIMAMAEVLLAAGVPAAGFGVMGLLLPGVIYMFLGAQRFDRNALTAEGHFNARTKWIAAAFIMLFAAVAGGVALLLFEGARPIQYTVEDSNLEIHCMFGETVPLGDIAGLELAQALPEIAARTNGSAMGEKLRGSFSLAGGAPARIFTDNGTPPFIHFTVGKTEYYLNTSSAEQTENLFNDLVAK